LGSCRALHDIANPANELAFKVDLREVRMNLKHLTLGIVTAAAVVGTGVVSTAVAQEGLFVPGLVYRTGPYAPNGIPIANGFKDYFTLLNERDGGIEGVTVHDGARRNTIPSGVERYERLKSKNFAY
jgi:branched-chain amino acid transport system substrate-binding protein